MVDQCVYDLSDGEPEPLEPTNLTETRNQKALTDSTAGADWWLEAKSGDRLV